MDEMKAKAAPTGQAVANGLKPIGAGAQAAALNVSNLNSRIKDMERTSVPPQIATALNDQSTAAKEATVQWQGLSKAVRQVSGTDSAVATGSILAFAEGLRIGSRLAQQLGTDMTAMDATFVDVKKNGGAAQMTIDNFAASLRNAMFSIAGFDTTRLKQDLKELASDAAGLVERFNPLVDRGFARAVRDLLGVSVQGRPDDTSHQYTQAIGPEGLPYQFSDAEKAAMTERLGFQTQLLQIKRDIVLAQTTEEKDAKLVSLAYDHQVQMLQLASAIHAAELDHNSTLIASLRRVAAAEDQLYTAKKRRVELDADNLGVPLGRSLSSVIGSSGQGLVGVEGGSLPDFVNNITNLMTTIPISRSFAQLERESEAHVNTLAQMFAKEAAAGLNDRLRQDLIPLFVDLGTTGGKHFAEMASQMFSGLIAEGSDKLFSQIFGKRGDGRQDPSTGQYLPGSDPNQIYGGIFGPKGTKVAQAGLAGVQIGVGAYENALQGGSRTAGTIGGALAGAGMGAQIGGLAFPLSAPSSELSPARSSERSARPSERRRSAPTTCMACRRSTTARRVSIDRRTSPTRSNRNSSASCRTHSTRRGMAS
jgi:hypothetical protein